MSEPLSAGGRRPGVSRSPTVIGGSRRGSLGGVPALNVVDYGADATGATDSSGAIQSAINALPSDGGTVYLPAGTYVIASLVFLRPGVVLRGAGHAYISSGGPTTLSVTAALGFQLGGGSPTASYLGGGLVDLNIVGSGGASFGINLVNTHDFTMEHVALQGFPSISLLVQSNGPGASQRNIFRSVSFVVPDVNGAVGLSIRGTAAQSSYDNSFDDTTFLVAATASHSISLMYLDAADSNLFNRTLCYISGTRTNVWPITLDYTVTSVFPSDNRWHHIDFDTAVLDSGNGVRNFGAPVNALPNVVSGVILENGYPADPLLPNLIWGVGGELTRAKAGNPVAADMPPGTWSVWKNTSSGAVALWVNDGGVMKSVALA